MHASHWPRLLLAAAFVLIAAGCSDGTAEPTTSPPDGVTSTAAPTTAAPPATTAPPETTAAPTTAEPATTTAAPTTTTTEAPATTTTAAPSGPFVFGGDGFFPDVLGGPLDAHGSGCAPGAGPLPDGIWFGFPTAWTASSIEFDLACFYTGDAATAEAAARGEESPPPNDYIVTNDNPTIRTVPVADGAIGHRLNIDIETEAVPFGDFIADPGEFQICFEFCLMWLYVNGGEVTEITSQFVP